MIVVDALDERGTNTNSIVHLLTSLNAPTESNTVKTRFLGGEEIGIGELLEDYAQISIAAQSVDLGLYVAAAIEHRIREKMLRIRDSLLKEHIKERLVEGAAGM